MKVWSAAELRHFVTDTREDELHALYALIAATVMRRGEAVGLRWVQTDLEQGRLLVDHQLVDNGYEVLTGEPKSRRSRRVVSLDQETIALLSRRRQEQHDQRKLLGLRDEPVYVFTRPDGRTYRPDFVTKHFRVLVRRVGLPRIRLHDLRHTHATLGLSAGVPAKVMSDRLGHSTVLLTLDTYSHVTPAQDAAAADLIAGLVHGNPDVAEALRDPDGTHDPIEGSSNREEKS